MAQLLPVILAGGSGTRLWPESRTTMPKHLAPLIGNHSLIQVTANRVMAAGESPGLICVGAVSQAELIKQQLRDAGNGWADHLLFEPSAQNTAAAIHLAALYAAERFGPSSVMWVCPSDHVMTRPEALYEAVQQGLPHADNGMIVTFGIEPHRPETGYGYIQKDEIPKADGSTGWPVPVKRFVEKPPLERAQSMLDEGGYLWNSGMFLMRADTLIEAMEAFEPSIAQGVSHAYQGWVRNGSLDENDYRAVKAMPVDKAVMERTSNIMVVPCDPGWSDLGGWEAMWEIANKTADQNATVGDVVIESSTGNLVRAQSRLVAVAGVHDLAIVEMADAVLVAKRDAGDEIRGIVAQLSEANRTETVRQRQSKAPWGSLINLFESPSISVNHGKITGNASFGGDGKAHRITILEPGKSGHRAGAELHVAPGEAIMISGNGADAVELIEIIHHSAKTP